MNFEQGKLRATGNPLDLAISGPGFFTLRDSSGALFYTRNGQFHRDPEGKFVNARGDVVQSSRGDLATDGADVSILADGTVLQGGEPVATIALSDFDDLEQLKPRGAGEYSVPAAHARSATNAELRQGMLEESNVSSASEMLSVMAALRSAESGQRVVQVYDDLLGRAIAAFGQG